jgi:hypothetical protein
MGKVLAMIRRMTCAGAALLALTACGPMNQGSLGSTFGDKLAGIAGRGKMPAEAPAPLPPDLANEAPGQYLMGTLVSRNQTALMTRTARNRDTETWESPGQIAMTLRDGILIATRGLSEDLMGADTAAVRSALAASGGTVQRSQSYLDSEDQIRTRQLTCTISAAGQDTIATLTGPVSALKFEESCESPALVFKNTYWLSGPGGKIVQSRQVIAPSIGYVQLTPL